jgi:hypothetical protein
MTSMPGSSSDPVQRGDERPGDLLAGGVTPGVRDAVAVVATLAGQLDLTAGVTVELGPEGDQFAHPLGALGDQGPHRLDVAQADPGDQGVVEVLLRESSGSSAAAIPTLGPLRWSPR